MRVMKFVLCTIAALPIIAAEDTYVRQSSGGSSDIWDMYKGAACRTSHHSLGKVDYDYYIAPHAKYDFKKCQKKCREREECKGFEYNKNNGKCEIWTKYYGEVEYKWGFTCYWKKQQQEEKKEVFVAQPSIFQEVLPKWNPCNVDYSSEFVREGGKLNQVFAVLYEHKLCLYSYVELVGTEKLFHIHGNAPRFKNGDLFFDLSDRVKLGATSKEVCVDLDKNELDKYKYSYNEDIKTIKSAFRDRKAYINIHTRECPDGEQRGQFVPVSKDYEHEY